MIFLYSGTPGSGKSLHMAKDIRNDLLFGRAVICNFEIAVSKIKKKRGQFTYIDNYHITPEYLINFSREYFETHRFKEGAICLYLDEAQLLFNAREWQKNGRNEWLSFFTQHRKYGFDIVLVAQFDRMIDRQIRSLIEYEYKHRKCSNFGTFGAIMSLLSGGKLFVTVKVWYPLSEKVGSEFFRCRKRYYELYDTWLDFGAGASPPN